MQKAFYEIVAEVVQPHEITYLTYETEVVVLFECFDKSIVGLYFGI